eukprot:COSAG01_NODE_1918_length_8905_cov_2.532591_4_plen_113_part_00
MPLSQGWGKSLSVAVLALVAVMVTYIPPMVRAARGKGCVVVREERTGHFMISTHRDFPTLSYLCAPITPPHTCKALCIRVGVVDALDHSIHKAFPRRSAKSVSHHFTPPPRS